jgi:hypothetical protein
MKTITIHFHDAETVPPGFYDVAITNVQCKQSRSSFHPYIHWTFEILEGPLSGRKLFLSTSLSPKASWFLKKFLNAIGYPCDDEQIEFDPDKTKGQSLWVQIAPNYFNGKPSYTIVDFGQKGQ